MTETDPLYGPSRSSPGHPRGALAEAMTSRDAQLGEAIAALRAAAGSVCTHVRTLMHVAGPDALLGPVRTVAEKMAGHAGFAGAAQELHDIAHQLRVLEASVQHALEQAGGNIAQDE